MTTTTVPSHPNWPWLTDLVATDDDDGDDDGEKRGPSIAELCRTHRKAIDEIARLLEEDNKHNNNENKQDESSSSSSPSSSSLFLFERSKHDDLWILRFLLSHKHKVKPAFEAARATLRFRHEHGLDERDLRPFPPHEVATTTTTTTAAGALPRGCDEALKRYLGYCNKNDNGGSGGGGLYFGLPNGLDGTAVGIFSLASYDQDGLLAHVDAFPTRLLAFIYMTEWMHQWSDYLSRRTGRLIKTVKIVDLGGLPDGYRFRLENAKRDGAVMRKLGNFYPQLLEKSLICHAPGWIHVPWQVCRPLLPRRLVEKVDFIRPRQNEKDRQLLLRYMSMEKLPRRLGGENDAWLPDFALPQTS